VRTLLLIFCLNSTLRVFFSFFQSRGQEELPGIEIGGSMALLLSVTKHRWSNSATGAVLKLLEIERLIPPEGF
jgi:hypothetical protein